MWLRLAVFGLLCALAGYSVGRIETLSGRSVVLSLVKHHVDASTGPFVCTLGEHGNVRRYLNLAGVQTDQFDDIRTLDDRAMLVVFDGHELKAVEFTRFGYSFSEEKCSRINS